MEESHWGILPWLKQGASYMTLAGNKLFLLKPNLHELLDEVAIAELTLPEEIERMKLSNKTEDEQACACLACYFLLPRVTATHDIGVKTTTGGGDLASFLWLI